MKEDQNADVKVTTAKMAESNESANGECNNDEGKGVKQEKDDTKKEGQDVVFVQDVGFMVKITAPGVEPFDIQV